MSGRTPGRGGGRRTGRRRGRTPRAVPEEPFTLELHGLTHGAEGVGRRDDGKVCFVPGGLPGEQVVVRVTDERSSWSRGELLEVLRASPHRVEPPCPYARPGVCGGCALQHATPGHQAELLRQVVIDQLERIGHLTDPPVAPTVRPHPGDGLGYRNRARFAVTPDGRLGFHRAGSDEVVAIDRCRLLTPAAHAARVAAGDAWQGVESVTVRADEHGHALLEVVPGPGGLPPLPETDLAVALVDAAGVAHALRGQPLLRHRVGSTDFDVSATSFFQPSVAAAQVLVGETLAGLGDVAGLEVLDLFSGVGLLSHALAQAGALVTAVESHPSAVSDARRDLAELAVDVVQGDADAVVAGLVADGETVDAVVLDPPRRGAGADLCRDIMALRPDRVVYVSCDPASLARDAAALVAAGRDLGTGLVLERVVPVDQFTHTGHIEAVATFAVGSSRPRT